MGAHIRKRSVYIEIYGFHLTIASPLFCLNDGWVICDSLHILCIEFSKIKKLLREDPSGDKSQCGQSLPSTGMLNDSGLTVGKGRASGGAPGHGESETMYGKY